MSAKILIIDDEQWYVEPLFNRFEYEGIGYDYCETGTSGINRLMNANKNEYSAIILDMKLTLGAELREYAKIFDVPGVYVLQKLRELNKTIPILCYTVLSDEEIKNEISKYNAKHIVKAQDSIDILIKVIKVILSKD